MGTVLSIVGILGSFALLKYREKVGDMIGEADWMRKIGGVYNFILVVAVFMFFWSVAELTGTTDILFGSIRNLIPGLKSTPPPVTF